MQGLEFIFLLGMFLALIVLAGATCFMAINQAHHQKELPRVYAAFSQLVEQQETYRKVQSFLNRRLNRQRTLLVALFGALEGAAKGATQEETLAALEKFRPVINTHVKDQENTQV